MIMTMMTTIMMIGRNIIDWKVEVVVLVIIRNNTCTCSVNVNVSCYFRNSGMKRRQ